MAKTTVKRSGNGPLKSSSRAGGGVKLKPKRHAKATVGSDAKTAAKAAAQGGKVKRRGGGTKAKPIRSAKRRPASKAPEAATGATSSADPASGTTSRAGTSVKVAVKPNGVDKPAAKTSKAATPVKGNGTSPADPGGGMPVSSSRNKRGKTGTMQAQPMDAPTLEKSRLDNQTNGGSHPDKRAGESRFNGVRAPGHSSIELPASYRPSEAEPFMNERQRNYFRQKLLMWKDEILRQNRETLVSLYEESAQHADLADRATTEADRALELRARDRQRKLIAKINSALSRIDDGSYGYCAETGEPIGLKRLDARPIATLTVEAQERHERREKEYRDD